MRKRTLKKSIVTFMLIVALVFSLAITVNAAVSFNLGTTVIDVGMVMYWWSGYQGIPMAKNDYMSMYASFNNYYKVNAGYYNVTTQIHSGSVLNHSGYSVSFYRSVPVTALYRAYIANLNALPMTVTGGWVYTNP